MSEPRSDERFRFVGSPPIRALAIASVVAVVGAVLFVFSAARGWGALAMGAGLTLMLLAVLLAATALVLTRRLRCTLLLDGDKLTVLRSTGTTQVRWADVEDVLLEGRRMHVVERIGRRVSVTEPPGSPQRIFDAAVEAVKRRLDVNRGRV